jgi:hypothetical protein
MIALIEQNRRHSRATLKILRLRRDHIWPEAGMRYGKFIFSGSLTSICLQPLIKMISFVRITNFGK